MNIEEITMAYLVRFRLAGEHNRHLHWSYISICSTEEAAREAVEEHKNYLNASQLNTKENWYHSIKEYPLASNAEEALKYPGGWNVMSVDHNGVCENPYRITKKKHFLKTRVLREQHNTNTKEKE